MFVLTCMLGIPKFAVNFIEVKVRGSVSELNAFTYFKRIIYAISCNDIICYYASFLTKFPVGTFHPLVYCEARFSDPPSPRLIAPLPFYFRLESR